MANAPDFEPISSSPHNLDRFVAAQSNVFEAAIAEIRRGRKRGHWMWYIFPQIAGLGRSATAQCYAIASLDEARAYLAHPVLGPRLKSCVETLQDLPQSSPDDVFGAVDSVKLRSCLTLFAQAGGGVLFHAALNRWFDAEHDLATLDILANLERGGRSGTA
ncbi:DUF1810 domain-containing protein [Blastomonas aquatica]|uniref:Calpastatin n=1 Tax=Blastomonas aquatica TaxID=1510276 RepID=A0ABQ1IZF5_9SPHN|nr:DUF1810 domain-containing protein [Blastomonas aquatica]GGB55047.1 hypothetical protein GCM10010833_07150 [Blastomonas aquatica]